MIRIFVCLTLVCGSLFAQVNHTAWVQRQVDAPGQVVDFGGRTFSVDVLRLGPAHDGKVIRNLNLAIRPGTSTGCVEIIKDRQWAGRAYPNAPLNITFENVHVIGGLDGWTDQQEWNVERSKKTGWWRGGFVCITGGPNRVDSVTIRNCSVQRVGGSGVNLHANRFLIDNFKAYHVGQHAVGARCDGAGPSSGTVRGLRTREVGTVFDFAALDPMLQDTAKDAFSVSISGIRAEDTLGRTKIHGPWTVSLRDAWFTQTRFIPNWYGALNIIHGRRITVDGFRASGFLVAGVSTYNDPATQRKPEVFISNATVKDCFTGAIIQFPVFSVTNVTLEGVWQPFRSYMPSFAENVVSSNKMSDDAAVDQYLMAELQLEEFNRQNQASLRSHYWLPKVISDKLEERKSQEVNRQEN